MNPYQNIGNPMLTLPQAREVNYPSEIIDNRSGTHNQAANEIPCQFCGSARLHGPEGEKWSPEHHCWRCGYVSGVTTGVGEYEARRQFDAFRNWLSQQTEKDNAHPTLNPPTDADEEEIARMQSAIEDMQNKLASRTGG